MKRIIIIVSALLLMTASYAGATLTGTLTGGDTLFGSGVWNDATLSWEVYQSPDNTDWWVYDYVYTVSDRETSHLIFEVSSTFTEANIKEGTTAGYELNQYTEKNGNPGMPSDADPLYGLKWDIGGLTTEVTIVSDRMPMWGDFFAKGGIDRTNDTRLYAYNTGFSSDTVIPIGNGNAGGWALVPDTNSSAPVPEPATFILLGVGLLGAGGYLRKRKFTVN